MISEPSASPFRSVLSEEITTYFTGITAGDYDDQYADAKAVNIERMRENLENGREALSGQPMEGETLKHEMALQRQAQALARSNAQKRMREGR